MEQGETIERRSWRLAAAMVLHTKFHWTIEEATGYAVSLAETYYDDPDFANELGWPISPAEAVDEDSQYWEG